MITYQTTIEKFEKQGEKTGWTYVTIPAEIAQKLNPGVKKSYRVKGKLDHHAINQAALLPMGEGDFILPLNAAMRKVLGKRKGATLQVSLALDESTFKFCEELMMCLEDDPKAMQHFKSLSNSEQKYFSKWIDSAKTDTTKAKRITQTLNAMHKGYGYGQMIRAMKG